MTKYYFSPDLDLANKIRPANGALFSTHQNIIALRNMQMKSSVVHPILQMDGVKFKNSTIITDAGALDIRIYKPEVQAEGRPAFVFFHGGGTVIGNLDSDHAQCMLLVKNCGAIGISINYRLAPEYPAPAAAYDGYSALKWVASNAEMLNIDPSHIVLCGWSGGGMVVLSIAQIARDLGEITPMMQLAFYPNTDDRELSSYNSRIDGDNAYIINRKNIRDVMNFVVPGSKSGISPPQYAIPNRMEDVNNLCRSCFILAQNDPMRDEQLNYAHRLLLCDNIVEIHLIPGLPHGFDIDSVGFGTTICNEVHDIAATAVKRAIREMQELQ